MISINIVSSKSRQKTLQKTTFQLFCCLLYTKDSNAIFIGDLNMPEIDWLNNSSPAKYREFLQSMEENFLSQIVDFLTHAHSNILVVILVNKPKNILDVKAGKRSPSSNCWCDVQKSNVNFWRKSPWLEQGKQEESRVGGILWPPSLTIQLIRIFYFSSYRVRSWVPINLKRPS